jgi:integrase
MRKKFKGRFLPAGVYLDRTRNYVFVRLKQNGKIHKKPIGRFDDPGVVDRAIAKLYQMREQQRLGTLGIERPSEQMSVEDACDLYHQLHGSNRESKKGIKQFVRNLAYIKTAWAGRYIDTITYLDVKEYRKARLKDGVKESTVNREHTVITSLFNKLKNWRKIGQIPKHVKLPDENPGSLVQKADELPFVRSRLLSHEEFEMLWRCADHRMRRIVRAEMNAPLRLEDLKQLTKDKINAKANEFRGVQTKTGIPYYVPISEPMWELIRSAPGNQILDFSGFHLRWPKIARRAGLPGLQFRDLRRTAATALHDHGTKLKTISAMLGHSTISTTERYLGLRAENLQAAGKILGGLFLPPKDEPAAMQSDHKSDHMASEISKIELEKQAVF